MKLSGSTKTQVCDLTGVDTEVEGGPNRDVVDVGEGDVPSHTEGNKLTGSSTTKRATMIAGILVCKLFVAKLCMIILVPLGNTATIQFSTSELQEATRHFSRSCLIGKGAYGSVYIGKDVRSVGTTAAIKVLNEASSIYLTFVTVTFLRHLQLL